MIDRIISVADTYDAMTTNRLYRKSFTHQTAIDEIQREAGKQFDREVAEAFLMAYQAGEIGA